MSVTDLPALNASLNATSFMLLTAGWFLIKSGRRQAHKWCMVAALTVSAAFLTSYVIYHLNVGSVPFKGTGLIRTVYFAVLIPHVILAAAIVPMILVTVSRALSNRFDQHKKIARWTLPLWLYVSVTGVVVYLMLYQM
jgi:putative membrane protein